MCVPLAPGVPAAAVSTPKNAIAENKITHRTTASYSQPARARSSSSVVAVSCVLVAVPGRRGREPRPFRKHPTTPPVAEGGDTTHTRAHLHGPPRLGSTFLFPLLFLSLVTKFYRFSSSVLQHGNNLSNRAQAKKIVFPLIVQFKPYTICYRRRCTYIYYRQFGLLVKRNGFFSPPPVVQYGIIRRELY